VYEFSQVNNNEMGVYMSRDDDQQALTKAGELAGGEAKTGRFGAYFIWPGDFNPS
jgi:hypothetical protein